MLKKPWTLIKEVLQQKKKQELPIEFILKGRIISDLDEIANIFHKYWSVIVRANLCNLIQ